MIAPKFCHNKPPLVLWTGIDKWNVHCVECGKEVFYYAREDAVQKWNEEIRRTRKNDESMCGV